MPPPLPLSLKPPLPLPLLKPPQPLQLPLLLPPPPLPLNKPLLKLPHNKRVKLGLCKALLFLHPALLHPAFRGLALLCHLQPRCPLLVVLRLLPLPLLLLPPLLELMLWVCLMLRRAE